MNLRGKKLGVMVSSGPEAKSFDCAYQLAAAALGEGLQVYLYYMDEGVCGVCDKRVQTLKAKGAQLFACAYSAQRRCRAPAPHPMIPSQHVAFLHVLVGITAARQPMSD